MRKGFIGNTDKAWFDFLRSKGQLEEVNFWQPGKLRTFRVIEPGAPFFLRLKSPHCAVAGIGFFARYVAAPLTTVWDTFGEANGTSSYSSFRSAIFAYRQKLGTPVHDDLNCVILFHPVFFPESMWVSEPSGWHGNWTSGASFDIDQGEGKRVFDDCIQRVLELHDLQALPRLDPVLAPAKYGNPVEIRPRLGQGAFRLAVTDAYGRACAVTGEHSLPVLDAAHIRPFAAEGMHAVVNGLLLRTDVHRLFDKGYATVTPDLKFVVSERLKQEFDNGKVYYEFHGKPVRLPARKGDRPDPKLLQWHNDNCFERSP